MKPACKIFVRGICLIALFAVFAQAGALAAAKGSGKTPAHAKHRHHPRATNTFENERVKYTFQKITVSNVKGSKAATDSWQAGSKRPKHRHPAKAITTSTGKRVWHPVQKVQIDHPNMASELVNAQQSGAKPAHPHSKKK